MKSFVLLLALAALAGCAQKDAPPQAATEPQNEPAQAAPAAAAAEAAGEPSRAASLAPNVPAGEYKMDPAHSTLIFRVNHLGFSKYTARFRHLDAQLQ